MESKYMRTGIIVWMALSVIITSCSNSKHYEFTIVDDNTAKQQAAIKSGKGFITNGPILTFQADGHYSGEEVHISGTHKIHAEVTARSILPFATLEIIANGWVVGHKTIFVADNPPPVI
jgi:hypothetical protein